MVTALHVLASYFDAYLATWSDGMLTVGASGLKGSVLRARMRRERIQVGAPCLEWLPYATVRDLVLYKEDGNLCRSTTELRSLCGQDRYIRDIMEWTAVGQGRVLFTAL
ncbi:hypothetical protein PI124_g17097 [Phytophthora idaei]|nr:hypothetical protein PI125_g17627 [Phytophthora idaei]KAG3237919.1 hypothetical protein PI124_g17097 [Phytophthora idaei]